MARSALPRTVERTWRIVDATGHSPQITYYFYCGDQAIEERNGSGSTIATYVYGRFIDEPITMRRGGTDYYYHADDQYNVLAVTDNAGNVVERYDYDAFGKPTIYAPDFTVRQTSAIGNTLMFNGRVYDPETGFYYYRTRYLYPRSGRFTTRDSIGIWGDPANLGNGYTYVGNNPWNQLDPYGEQRGFYEEHVNRGNGWVTARYYDGGMTGLWPKLMGETTYRVPWPSNEPSPPSLPHDMTWERMETAADWGASFLPFVNDGRDAIGLVSGRDPITGRKLTSFDRALYGAGLVIGNGSVFKGAKDKVCVKLGIGKGKNAVHAAEAIPGNPFRGKDAAEQAYKHLEKYHGVKPTVASERLHQIKQRVGMGAADDVIIGRTGDIYNAKTNEWIGTLTKN